MILSESAAENLSNGPKTRVDGKLVANTYQHSSHLTIRFCHTDRGREVTNWKPRKSTGFKKKKPTQRLWLSVYFYIRTNLGEFWLHWMALAVFLPGMTKNTEKHAHKNNQNSIKQKTELKIKVLSSRLMIAKNSYHCPWLRFKLIPNWTYQLFFLLIEN